MTPISFSERLVRLDEWKRIHTQDFEDILKDVRHLQRQILAAPIIDSVKVNSIEHRLGEIERWQSNIRGRMWGVGIAWPIVVALIFHFWK